MRSRTMASPPPVDEALLGDDEVARRDLVPAPRQAVGDRGAGLVVVGPDRGLRFSRERDNDFAVKRLPHVRHEPAAVGIEPADRQLFGNLSHIRGAGFVDAESHELGGLGNEVRLVADKPSATRLLLLVKAEHEQADVVRRRTGALGSGRFAGGRFGDGAFGFGLGHDGLLKSRRAPEGAPSGRVDGSERMARADPVVW